MSHRVIHQSLGGGAFILQNNVPISPIGAVTGTSKWWRERLNRTARFTLQLPLAMSKCIAAKDTIVRRDVKRRSMSKASRTAA
jgi:hypothetical protein